MKLRYLYSILFLAPSLASAETIYYQFNDTNNVSVSKSISDVSLNNLINPAKDIDVWFSGGLDRKIVLTLTKGNQFKSVESDYITPQDEFSFGGNNYLGKKLRFTGVSEGEWTVTSKILNLSGKVLNEKINPIIHRCYTFFLWFCHG